jgi:hypothetical protein
MPPYPSSATFVVEITKLPIAICASKVQKDGAPVKVVEAEVTLVLRARKDLGEKVVQVVVKDKKAVKIITTLLIIPHVLAVFVRNKDISPIIVRMLRNLQVF